MAGHKLVAIAQYKRTMPELAITFVIFALGFGAGFGSVSLVSDTVGPGRKPDIKTSHPRYE